MDGVVDGGKKGVRQRFGRIIPWVVTIGAAALMLHWAAKWLRGEPDDYPHEIVGGFVLCLSLTLGGLSELVQSAPIRRTILAMYLVTVVLGATVIFGDAQLKPAMVVAMVIVTGGLATIVHALWREPGLTWAEWKVTPVSKDRRRRVCVGFALMNVGAAIFVASLSGWAQGPSPLNLLVILPTVLFIGMAVWFMRVRARLRR